MTTQDQITTAIANGETVSITWGLQNVSKISYGEDIGCIENQLIVMTQWIRALQDYLDRNFDGGGIIEPDFECLSLDQVEQIISKINIIFNES